MAILIKNNEPSLVDMTPKDFIKLGVGGVYVTMKTVCSYEYIFNFTGNMNNLYNHAINLLKSQENLNQSNAISHILENLSLEYIRKYCIQNIKKGFEFLNSLDDDIKNKHFSDNTDYMVMAAIDWSIDNNIDTTNKPFSILIYIKCLPKHSENVEVDIMHGERTTPNIKYSNVFEIREKLLKLKSENSNEVVLYNRDNEITEGLTSNFFCYYNGALHTAKDELVLNGTMRKQIINICERENIKIKKTSININDIDLFEFCFISSTSRNILPIKKITLFPAPTKTFEKDVKHPILIKLQEKLREDVEKQKEKYVTYEC
ncbi:aminodeoxychorismate lyase, putative [Plasmodium chabaudi chabaudi]|uniref:Aminodeoxychorismate lyase, putative n=1 Tax=Plasmodium chabaudi chabaudi TaxID=31271 RepID=A0A1C6XK53_PLACU|nr:aminodeoxychorismate lyase, putative [Plasmodium chabaudi chabaudi]